jgi:polysaccharide export outer membrane protein
LDSKKTLEDYIIDSGDKLYIEFENNSKGNPDLIKKEKFRDNLTTEYLKTNTNLEDYFLDEDDQISIKFIKTPELNNIVTIDRQGEVFLPRIKETYVRGLSIYELSKLLESRYQEFLIDPEIEVSISRFRFLKTDTYSVDLEGEIFLPRIKETYVRGLTPGELSNLLELKYSELGISSKITIKIATFKRLRVLVSGEIRLPGVYEFPAYSVGNFKNVKDQMGDDLNEELSIGENLGDSENTIDSNSINEELRSIDNARFDDSGLNNESSVSFEIKRPSEKITTISNAIKAAGGITSKTDLSRIEIIRDVPIGKGGGNKRAYIDFSSFLNESDPSNDIRLFDGDRLFFSKLDLQAKDQIPKSILTGLSPRFISVNLFGRVENPGVIKLPLEASLSDAIDLSGPIKPLSGKIVLIRYNKDGTIIKKNISYSARAKKGSKRNPYLEANDLISVKNSLLGKSTGVIREITAPFVGIYTTKEIIGSFD